MKKFKTALLTLIVSLCLVFGLAFAVACGEEETTGGDGSTTDQTQDNDTKVTYYTVTLSFDDTKGSVTKSSAAAADGYVKDETVTLTVTPKSGYVVDSVKAGDATLTPGTDGKYSLKIVGDVTVTVTFKDAPTYYTVTLSYDNTKGSVDMTDSAAADGYAKDESVTLTVTPTRDYLVDTVKVGDETLTLGTDGTYTFTVSGNVTVTVTFKDAPASENALLLDEEYYGTYHDMDKDDPADDLVVNKRGVFWGDDEVFAVEYEQSTGTYTVTVGDSATEYFFTVNEEGTISLFTGNFSVEKTFLKDGVKLTYTVTLTVAGDPEWGTATLTPEKERYEQGESVTLTVTPAQGYIVDRVSVDYEDVSLENGTTYTFLVTKNTEIYVYFKKDVSIPTELQGVWTNILDSSDSFTLGAKEMTWGGHAVTIDSIDERITYDEVTFEPSVVGIDVSYTIDGAEGMATFLFNTSAVRIALTDPETWVEENYIFLHGDGKSTDTDITSGPFTQIGGEIKLAVGEKGHVSVGDAELPMYFLKDEMYGEVYYVLYQNAYRRLMINNDNYLTFEPADSEAADQTVLQFLRDNFTVKPYVLVAGEWNAEGGVKLNFKDDGSVELTGKEGVTIRLLASDASGTSTLVTSGNKSWEAALNPTFSESDGAYTLSFEYLLSETGATTFSRTLSKFTLDSTWQSGYVYEGIDYVPFEKFVVNETGLVPVDQFNNPIESQYAYAAATVSENEYIIVIPDPVYGSGTFYTLTLDATDHKITIKTSSGQEFVYTQGEVEPMEIFTITLSYDNTQGTVSIDGGSVDDTGMVYTFAKPDSGETVSVYISVYTNGIYETDSVKVGDQDVSYDEEMFCYVFTADGLSNVTITITFKAKTYDLLVIEDETLHNTTWSCSDPLYESTKLVIDADGHVKFGNKDVSYMDDSYNGYSVIIDGAQWTFITTDMANGTITLMDAFTEMYVFTKDGGSTAPAATYHVTFEYELEGGTYDETMGVASADKESYNSGETVTITVTPSAGYAVKLVVAGEALTAQDDGTYTFEITADTTVSITFEAATAAD